jgi:predicted TPR repeat methyltransferase
VTIDHAEQAADPPEPAVREIGLDEALVLAVECQRSGRFEDAGSLYRKILELVPGHPAATHYSGILAQQQGRLEEATALLERSLALDPKRADWYANLAVNLEARGMLDEAIAASRRAIEVDPGHTNALSNLGALLRAKGRVAEAEEAYRAAIRLDADHIAAYMNLGILLASQRRTQEAVWCYCKVTTLNAHYPPARRMLALAHIMVGEVDKARRLYEESLAQDPDDPVAKHMLAACSGADMPARASNECVSTLFDGFAANFETRLAQLDYRAPELVECMLAASGIQSAKTLDVVDAGCGTGLCGKLLSPYARRLTGVDLSGGMLQLAAQKGVYDDLVQCELTAYLRAHPGQFDAIVSADTLVYFGGLEEVASAAAAALRDGGRLVFTVEEWTDAGQDDEFTLRPLGRYVHSQRYVERAMGDVGLIPRVEHGELRLEGGAPVPGLVVCATKAGSGGVPYA